MQRTECDLVRRDKNGLLRAAVWADKLAVDKVVAGTAAVTVAVAVAGIAEETRAAARARRTRVKVVAVADAAVR